MPATANRRDWRTYAERTSIGAALVFLACGCSVGPDYARPAAPTSGSWIEAQQPGVRTEPVSAERWWDAFQDPVLSGLVDAAYQQNLSLRAAGLRVLQAQARRAVAIGDLFPQQQALRGGYTSNERSTNAAFSQIGPRAFDTWQAGFDTVWELDLWGKFRRAIEAADSDLLAAVADYDDVLVSLIAEVAATYVRIRVLDERLAVARDNVRVQRNSLEIARVRFEAGGTSELDVQQATALLEGHRGDDSAARHRDAPSRRLALRAPRLAAERARAACSAASGHVPHVPATMAVGIPADLLRRRPDVRRAERAAAAQSARIGVSTADLLPSFQLVGSIGLRAEDAANFFEGRSFEASTGPAFNWPILNYGRLVNDVRLQDATFQELAVSYANTVLTAQQEVEDALVGYLRGSRAGGATRPRAWRLPSAPSRYRGCSIVKVQPTSRRSSTRNNPSSARKTYSPRSAARSRSA